MQRILETEFKQDCEYFLEYLGDQCLVHIVLLSIKQVITLNIGSMAFAHSLIAKPHS